MSQQNPIKVPNPNPRKLDSNQNDHQKVEQKYQNQIKLKQMKEQKENNLYYVQVLKHQLNKHLKNKINQNQIEYLEIVIIEIQIMAIIQIMQMKILV